MEDEKLTGRLIIETILVNMRQQIEELRYSKIVPAAYDVYLHADDRQRFESLAHEIATEAVRALQESLDGLNRPSRLDRVRELVRKPRLPFKKVGPWLVRITGDPDDIVPRGRALVVSQLALSSAEGWEGARTRRLATMSDQVEAGARAPSESRDVASATPPERESRIVPASAPHGSRAESSAPREPAPAEAPRLAAPSFVRRDPSGLPSESAPETVGLSSAPATAGLSTAPATAGLSTAPATAGLSSAPASIDATRGRALAVLLWDDDAGSHVHRMDLTEILVGRDAGDSVAHVRLHTVADVSRKHLVIRYDAEARGFTIEDLSLLGTTVNGRSLLRGAPEPLPAPATIRLADAIELRFESEAVA